MKKQNKGHFLKYLTQWDNFRCSAIAYLNLLIWLGYKRTDRDIPAAERQVKCRYNEGTRDADLYKALKRLKGIKVSNRWSWTRKEVIKRLQEGKPIIFSQTFKKPKDNITGHSVFIPGYDQASKRYIITNPEEGIIYCLSTEAQLIDFLRRGGVYFFITKRQKRGRVSCV